MPATLSTWRHPAAGRCACCDPAAGPNAGCDPTFPPHHAPARALKSIIAKLTHLPALDALVHRALPESVMKMVLEQVGRSEFQVQSFPTYSCVA
jgi:hypothetical protein